MSSKIRKVSEEMQVFQEKCAFKYFFVEFKQKAFCLICKEMVTVMKDYIPKRHYNTKNTSRYNDLEEHFQSNKLQQLENQPSGWQLFCWREPQKQKTVFK
jgi:hypothetical protein